MDGGSSGTGATAGDAAANSSESESLNKQDIQKPNAPTNLSSDSENVETPTGLKGRQVNSSKGVYDRYKDYKNAFSRGPGSESINPYFQLQENQKMQPNNQNPQFSQLMEYLKTQGR